MVAYLGIYTARLEMPWVRSLKEKRALVKPAVEKLKSRFPVSAARLAGQDEWNWEAVAFTLIGHDRVWVEATLHQAAHFLTTHGGVQVAQEWWQIEEISLEAVLPAWEQ